ncbi:RluA family pseudouridine synthase [Brevibacillus massiliensis]|uniref:RluA family pseudouridine synthase n=1 Tax=Brevibacillus massiliensis TaxID=1118054 RepID=UPI0002EFAF8A|nr:RluA family pseudouridine synthase [Brevibacillus massiliensis]
MLLQFEVTEADEGKTIRDVLQTAYGVSRRLLTRAKYGGSVCLNGAPAYVTERLKKGDQVTLVLPAEEAESLVPQPMPLAIRHEDEDLLILAKPAGMVVHPTRTHPDGTLANGVVAYWQAKGESRKFRPVNRLDKDTSGLLIVAKNQWAHEQFARMQRQRTLGRTYQAIVEGLVADEQGVIEAPIGLRDDSIIVREVRPDGQYARTHYRVLGRGEDMTWLELHLQTGRTHQIRVHLSYLGHPLAGDDLYGGSRERIGRQALHAARLSFCHPRSQEMLTLTEPVPPDMAQLIGQIESRDGADE